MKSFRGESPLRGGVEPINQPSQHAFDLADSSGEFMASRAAQYPKIGSKQEKVFQLACGAHRNIKELFKLSFAASPASFGDIRRNRSGRAAHLAHQTKAFFHREFSRRLVNQQRHGVAFLPDTELFEVLHYRGLSVYVTVVYV